MMQAQQVSLDLCREFTKLHEKLSFKGGRQYNWNQTTIDTVNELRAALVLLEDELDNSSLQRDWMFCSQSKLLRQNIIRSFIDDRLWIEWSEMKRFPEVDYMTDDEVCVCLIYVINSHPKKFRLVTVPRTILTNNRYRSPRKASGRNQRNHDIHFGINGEPAFGNNALSIRRTDKVIPGKSLSAITDDKRLRAFVSSL